MKLNKRQRIAVWVGLGLAVFMGLFPSEEYTSYENLAGESVYREKGLVRVLVQWFLVVAVTGGAVFALKDRDEGAEP